MRSRPLPLILLCAGWALVAVGAEVDESREARPPVRVVGLNAVSKPVSLAIPILSARGIKTKLNAENSSQVAIGDVGSEREDIALSMRAITAEDRAPYPHKRFMQIKVCYQALALVVSEDVWNSGVHSLTHDQIQAIYERRVTNWHELGGADEKIRFYCPESGHGIWEYFVTWLYGEIRKAPLGDKFEQAHDGEEARNLVEFNSASLSVVPPSFADQKAVFALAVGEQGGTPAEPTVQNIRDGRYPLARPLFLVSGERPTGDVRHFIDFMIGDEGQALVEKSFLTTIEARDRNLANLEALATTLATGEADESGPAVPVKRAAWSPETRVLYAVLGILFAIWTAGVWRVFEKAEEPGWAAIVPIYRTIVMLDVGRKPFVWILLFLIPGLNVILSIALAIAVARGFRKSALFGVGLFFLPFIFFPILGFGSARYYGSRRFHYHEAEAETENSAY